MNNRSRAMAAIMGSILIQQNGKGKVGGIEIPKSKGKPWDNIDIPKSARKGKTYEEIQAMRKKIWEGK